MPCHCSWQMTMSQAASASKLAFEAAAGVTYYLAVDGYGVAKGEVVLTLTLRSAYSSRSQSVPSSASASLVQSELRSNSRAPRYRWHGSRSAPTSYRQTGWSFPPPTHAKSENWLLPGTVWDVAERGNPPGEGYVRQSHTMC